MTPFWIGLLVGVCLGAPIGVLFTAMAQVAARGDRLKRRLEKERR